jgi:hypothetical protein
MYAIYVRTCITLHSAIATHDIAVSIICVMDTIHSMYDQSCIPVRSSASYVHANTVSAVCQRMMVYASKLQ